MEKDLIKKDKQMAANYHRTNMQKETVLQRLKENGCRITKQRKILLDIILQEECACCKEIYYKALENQCVGAFFGHTHRASYTEMDDVVLMNPGSLTRPRDGSGGTFGLIVTGEDSIWGKIYRYEDFMSSGSSSGGSSQGGINKPKPKVRGGHLRDLLNYSDRF